MRHNSILLSTIIFVLCLAVTLPAFAFTFTDLDIPGAIATYPLSINNRGQIVGYYWDGDYVHGFVLNKNVFTTIDVPGASVTYATGINDLGLIVGYYWDVSGNQHGFLAAP